MNLSIRKSKLKILYLITISKIHELLFLSLFNGEFETFIYTLRIFLYWLYNNECFHMNCFFISKESL